MILYDNTVDEITEYIISSKSRIMNCDIYEIMNATSVNNIENYIPEKVLSGGGSYSYKELINETMRHKKGTPVHVKAAINYNILKEQLGLSEYAYIESGDKVLWGYLATNKYDFDTIVLRGYDDPPEIINFVKEHLHREKIFDKVLRTKLQSIFDDLGWGKIVTNKNIFKVFSFN
jgi:hypothetical protein